MNWITDYVRPKITSLLQRREMPENLWQKCSSCNQMVFHRTLTENLNVCPHCAHHMPISPEERLKSIFDDEQFTVLEVPEVLADPLGFKDEKKYTDRIKAARKKTGDKEAATVTHGEIGEIDAVCVVQNFAFLGGSMGMAVGQTLLRGAEKAIELKSPLIVFSAAGGARMQEGILSLMQMPRTTIAVQMLRENNLPFIVVLTHPTTGGVTASFAMLGDIHIAEPKALICFAGPRVIEQTIREKLPKDFQRSEYLLEHGMLDMVIDRRQMRTTLITTLRMLMKQPSFDNKTDHKVHDDIVPAIEYQPEPNEESSETTKDPVPLK